MTHKRKENAVLGEYFYNSRSRINQCLNITIPVMEFCETTNIGMVYARCHPQRNDSVGKLYINIYLMLWKKK